MIDVSYDPRSRRTQKQKQGGEQAYKMRIRDQVLTMRRRGRAIIVFQLLIVGPFASEKSEAQLISDSAGVTILTYGHGAAPSGPWAVGAAILEIGSGSSEVEQFWNIAGISLLGNGALVVGDGGSSELRFFNTKTGTHIRTVAGEGPGPGEIRELWSMFTLGDTTVAVDSRGAASYFDPNGQYRRRLPPPVSNLGRRLRRAGFFAGGNTLAYAVEADTVSPDQRAVVQMRIVALSGDEPRPLLRYPHHIVTRRGNARPWGLIYGPVTDLVALDDRFCVGFPRDYVIDCFTESGDPLYRIVREASTGEAVTQGDRADYFAVSRAANPGPRGEPYLAYLRDNAQFAEEFPPFGRLVASKTGELWVGPFIPEGDTPVLKPFPLEETKWSVYSRDGMWLSDVELPARFRLMYAGHAHVAGVLRDSSDVESVAVLPLHRN